MANETPQKMGRTEWLICIIAAIGFAFDIYELLMLPLMVRPAIEQLGGFKLGSPEFGQWRDLLIYVPALAGGVLVSLAVISPTGWGVDEYSSGRFSFMLFPQRQPRSQLRCRCCFSSAAPHSSVCVLSSWPRSRGWLSSSRAESAAKLCSDTHRRFRRLAGLW